jgi:ribosomal protein S18 acetylase RimI-like enzyme
MPFDIRPFQHADEAAVIDLWRRCELTRPQNDPAKDIRRKLTVQPEMFLLAVVDGVIVGSIMAGYEGHRGWINYLATAPEYRRRGIGVALMQAAERLLNDAGCPKINLQVRPGNDAAIAFYRSIGFDVEGAISMGKRLTHDQ